MRPCKAPVELRTRLDYGGFRASAFAVPDIFYRGEMLWPKGIGMDCCYVGVKFLRDIGKVTCVFDPFVGKGTVTSMANAMGLNALGIELSSKRCKFARLLQLTSELHRVSRCFLDISLGEVEQTNRSHRDHCDRPEPASADFTVDTNEHEKIANN